jgi:hypothetical protein
MVGDAPAPAPESEEDLLVHGALRAMHEAHPHRVLQDRRHHRAPVECIRPQQTIHIVALKAHALVEIRHKVDAVEAEPGF